MKSDVYALGRRICSDDEHEKPDDLVVGCANHLGHAAQVISRRLRNCFWVSMPVSDIVQPFGETILDLGLLRAPARPKAKTRAPVRAPRASGLDNRPAFAVDGCEKLATSFRVPPTRLPIPCKVL